VNRLFDRLELLIRPLLAFLLAFITVGIFIVVVARYVFATSFLFGEELSLFAFIWCVFLGAAICVRHRTHFAFDYFETLTGRVAGVQRLIVDLTVLAMSVLILVEGWNFSQLNVQRLSPALGISLFIPTLVIPISGALMILALIGHLCRDIRQILTGRAV
jgi:TRAP-type transport system small permease protein